MAYTTAIRRMLTHAQYILCFCHFWWTVPTTLCLRYWHSYLSTMVNSFTLRTQNGTVKTKKVENFVLYAWLNLSDSTGHSFHLSSNSTKEHYIPRKYSGCYISQRLSIQLEVLDFNAYAVPTYLGSSLLCITSFRQPTSLCNTPQAARCVQSE